MCPFMLFCINFFPEFIFNPFCEKIIHFNILNECKKSVQYSVSNSTSSNFCCLLFTYSRFACPFCGKCVRSKENLKLHVRKHTGERPFVCLFCGRAFGGKSDLTRHLRIHTGERPYHCESCGKCFARADYLSKHLTTHVHNSTPR